MYAQRDLSSKRIYSAKSTDMDYKNIELTEEEKKEGWSISHCRGNGFVRGCGKPYRTLNWYTPSGCPNCPATFVD